MQLQERTFWAFLADSNTASTSSVVQAAAGMRVVSQHGGGATGVSLGAMLIRQPPNQAVCHANKAVRECRWCVPHLPRVEPYCYALARPGCLTLDLECHRICAGIQNLHRLATGALQPLAVLVVFVGAIGGNQRAVKVGHCGGLPCSQLRWVFGSVIQLPNSVLEAQTGLGCSQLLLQQQSSLPPRPGKARSRRSLQRPRGRLACYKSDTAVSTDRLQRTPSSPAPTPSPRRCPIFRIPVPAKDASQRPGLRHQHPGW